jgi:signal transduction histidine kinase
MQDHQQLPALSAVYRVYGDIYSAATLDTQGNVVASGWGKITPEQADTRTNLSNRRYFKAIMQEGKTLVREPLISSTFAQPAIIFAVPIYAQSSFTLGQKDQRVEWLQKSLRDMKYYQGELTGHYDELTYQAVLAYQKDYYGLTPTGEADPLTFDLIHHNALKEWISTDTAKNIIGVAFVATFLSDLGELIETTRLGKTGYVFLVSEKGEVLAHPDEIYVKGEHLTDFSQQSPVKDVLNSDAQQQFYDFTDEHGTDWFTYSILLANGWRVFALQGKSEVLEKERLFWSVAMGVAILATVLIALFTSLLANYLLKPISQLTHAATQLAQGDWNQQVSVEREDEIGLLANSFNQMAMHLRLSFSILEENSNQAQKAQKLAEQENRIKTEFIAHMAHELRTPLNAIIGYSEMLKEDELDRPIREAVDDLEKIRSSGQHLLTLINQVLDFSKVEAGKMDLNLTEFEIEELLSEITVFIDPLLRKNGNCFQIQIEPNIEKMYADFTKLKQCLLNLLSNACKFTEAGQITLEVSAFEHEEEAWLAFRVRDTGMGMTPDQLERMFKVFTQATSAISSKFGGTGLGLVITRQFCRLMGGEVTVESCYGQGTVFIITLPKVVTPLSE